jgi:hypothetical protein
MNEKVQALKAIAQRIELLYHEGKSAGDHDLLWALIELGDMADTIIRLCDQHGATP